MAIITNKSRCIGGRVAEEDSKKFHGVVQMTSVVVCDYRTVEGYVERHRDHVHLRNNKKRFSITKNYDSYYLKPFQGFPSMFSK